VLRFAWLLALVAVAIAAGCSSSPEKRESTESERRTSGIALVRMPARALARCRGGSLVALACPTLVPSSRWRDRAEWSNERGRLPFRGVFELGAGAEHPGQPEQDRPPRLVHLVVLGGREATRGFRWPRPATAVVLRDRLYGRERHRALSFGTRTWAGRHGELVLAPAFPEGGIVGNHLIFRWREGGAYYAVSLHGWEPFTETVGVLRAVVESIQRS
jgi:hypothetical protein